MTPRLYIQLGKAGDILSLLPLLWLDAQKGERSAIMVSKAYGPILEGCSYLDPVIFDGDPHELARAHAEAVASKREVICCQVNGPPDQVAALTYGPRGLAHATTESFQKEAWKIAGRLKDWRDQPPLVFDKRNPEREAEAVKFWPKKKKVILVSYKGTSSPFPYADLLMELLRLKFGKQFEIFDLSKRTYERFYDLLALYEKAHCLVTTDSAPLHLAYACKTLPVVALVNDRPLLWSGSCWRPNHIFHCRYRDFPRRAVKMLRAIERITVWSRYNRPSVARKVVHVWSAYEQSEANEERTQEAFQSWEWLQENWNDWTSTEIEIGMVGQDSAHSELKDTKRFPFVHDVLRLACLRAEEDDQILLTRCDTSLLNDIPSALNALGGMPGWHHRVLTGPTSTTHHPAVDLFCFTKKWWREHQDEYPARMVMGQDPYWHRILMELVKKHGGKELKGCVYRAWPKKV